jgi:hypothetical protein
MLWLLPLALACAAILTISFVDTVTIFYGDENRFPDGLILLFVSCPLLFPKAYLFDPLLKLCGFQFDPQVDGQFLMSLVNFLTDVVILFFVFSPFAAASLLLFFIRKLR